MTATLTSSTFSKARPFIVCSFNFRLKRSAMPFACSPVVHLVLPALAYSFSLLPVYSAEITRTGKIARQNIQCQTAPSL